MCHMRCWPRIFPRCFTTVACLFVIDKRWRGDEPALNPGFLYTHVRAFNLCYSLPERIEHGTSERIPQFVASVIRCPESKYGLLSMA
ncbi:MAG TPA: hypothetical protein VF798_05850, partial [Burkholderiaceae bacterium]